MGRKNAGTGAAPAPAGLELPEVLLRVLAVFAVLAAILRVFTPYKPDQETLLFLALAAVILLLRDVKSLAIGDSLKVEFREKLARLSAKVEEVEAVAERAEAVGAGGAQIVPAKRPQAVPSAPGVSAVADDPQKGKWGGVPERLGRRLSAIVRPTRDDPALFDVYLEVSSVDARRPLEGDVTFHLHDTFPRPVRTVRVRSGVARLHLIAYGAFTVGAETDGGQVKLELDLAKLEGAPEVFKKN